MLERIESVFQAERLIYGIRFQLRRGLKNVSHVTAFPGGALITLRADLRSDLALEAAGMCVARIALGHDFRRAGYREATANRDEWRASFRWLARRLIPDALMSRAMRKAWDRWDLAEAAGTTDHLTIYRMTEWRAARGEMVTFPVFCHDALERAAEEQDVQWCDLGDGPFFCQLT